MRDRVEALDCFVYSYAALLMLGPDTFQKLGDLAEKVAALEPEVTEDTTNTVQEKPTLPQVRPGVVLHQPRSSGFGVFSQRR